MLVLLLLLLRLLLLFVHLCAALWLALVLPLGAVSAVLQLTAQRPDNVAWRLAFLDELHFLVKCAHQIPVAAPLHFGGQCLCRAEHSSGGPDELHYLVGCGSPLFAVPEEKIALVPQAYTGLVKASRAHTRPCIGRLGSCASAPVAARGRTGGIAAFS